MANVFLAVARGQMDVHKLVVIKRLRETLAQDPAFRTMFIDEARLAARLNHPNIVHTFEVGEDGGAFFIAMEYLEGQSLNKVVRALEERGAHLSPAVAVRIVIDALSGLAHAHSLADYNGRPLSIVHRDVSPHNVFVTYDGHTKLVDFGIAKAALSTSQTEIGVLKGKVAYMAPEQAMGGALDQRADLFAMGIVLWELLTHRRLFYGESAANSLHKLMNEPIPRMSSVVEGVDACLDDLVAKALEKDVDQRWQNATAMRDALDTWLATRKRAPDDDVARTMHQLFGDVRENVQRQVQHQMEALRGSSAMPVSDALGVQTLASAETSLRSTLASEPARLSWPVRVMALLSLVALALFVWAFVARKPSGGGVPVVQAPPPAIERSADPLGSSPVSVMEPMPPSTGAAEPARPRLGARPPAGAKMGGAKPRPSAPSEERENGYLTITAYPWAKVSEGGRIVCAATPCSKVPLSPGTHTLQLENPELPMRQTTTTVTIKSGETLTRAFVFQ
jgi:serine/threonine-protein kinase